jgi:hypothetical protein
MCAGENKIALRLALFGLDSLSIHWKARSMLPNLSAQDFVAKWRRVELSERSMVQQHFLDLCRLVGHEPPAEYDPSGQSFAFEMGAEKTAGGQGWADVAKIGFFG